MGFRVIGDFAAVTLGEPDGNGVVRVLERGAVLPEGVHESVTAHLVGVGLVEEFEDEAPAFDVDAATLPELKAYAGEHRIDLGDATKKDDVKEAVVAALAG